MDCVDIHGVVNTDIDYDVMETEKGRKFQVTKYLFTKEDGRKFEVNIFSDIGGKQI